MLFWRLRDETTHSRESSFSLLHVVVILIPYYDGLEDGQCVVAEIVWVVMFTSTTGYSYVDRMRSNRYNGHDAHLNKFADDVDIVVLVYDVYQR